MSAQTIRRRLDASEGPGEYATLEDMLASLDGVPLTKPVDPAFIPALERLAA